MQLAQFDNSYARLPERLYSRVAPCPVRAPELIRVNQPLAQQLGIDPAVLSSEQGVRWVAGNEVPEGADPIALAYAGHQFGHFNPQLGDGRAVLLGEVRAPDGTRYDLQLKGSGVTPWSRGGDGRSPLGPVLREYVVSEAMAALGVPTSRALAAVTSGEPVLREQPLPGAVLLRVARSHIRVGTFEYFAARKDTEALGALVRYAWQRHYSMSPTAKDDLTAPTEGDNETALALLAGVAERQASLVAQWQLLGFIHGVMNTDNTLVSGETIDYGPCAFMDTYDPATVYSSIDQRGRYAYKNQPMIAQFNLACLARALLPLLQSDGDVAKAQAIIDGLPGQYATAYHARLGRKLGLSTEEEADAALGEDLLQALQDDGADFTLAFRHLADEAAATTPSQGAQDTVAGAGLFTPGPNLATWLERWRARLARDPRSPEARAADMATQNPVFIPRNHQVEAVIRAAEDRGDLAPFQTLVDALAQPYHWSPSRAAYARPPEPEERVLKTFCGT